MLTSTTWKLSCIIYPQMCNKNQIAIKILKIVKNTFVHFFVASIFRNVKFECMHTGSTGRIAYYHQGMCKQLTKGRKS